MRRGAAVAPHIEALEPIFSGHSARVGRASLVAAFVVERLDAITPASILEALEALGVTHASQITSELLDRWRTERASVREPSRPKRRVIHSPAQIATAVAWAVEHKLRGWALTAATLEATGLRVDEVRRMDESWITRRGVRLVPEGGAASKAWTSKRYRMREIELDDDTLTAVKEYVAWRLKGKGKTGKKVGISERWFGKVADKVTRAVALPGTYRPHDARRRWVTELVRAETPISVVQELVGHADVQTTERYVCSDDDDATVVQAPAPAAVKALVSEPGKVVALRKQNGTDS